MKDTILITGATGKVGRELVLMLRGKGESVRAATRHPAAWPAEETGALAVGFDYNDPTGFGPVLAGVKRLFLTAPPADPSAHGKVIPFVGKAVEAGVERVVFLSVMGSEKMDESPARIIEKRLERSGVAWTFLRANWFMQNLSDGFLLTSIREARAITLPVGGARTSLIDARDIAEAAAKALTEEGHANRAYTLTGPRPLDYEEVARIISDAAHKEVRYVPIPEDKLSESLRESGTPEPAVAQITDLFRAVRRGYAEEVARDTEEILGRKPRDFEAFARESAANWA